MNRRVAIICNHADKTGLVFSYARIFESQGYEIRSYDIGSMSEAHMKGNKLLKKAQRYIREDLFVRKANRDLSVALKEFKPDIVLLPGKTKILAGTIAYLKSFLPTKFVVLWQDTLCNLDDITISNAPLFDITASYSKNAIKVLETLGFKNCVWLPFAGDLSIHNQPWVPDNFEFDLTFLGGWRPEREKALETVAKNFPNIRLQIWGPNASEYKSPFLKGKIITKAIRGKEFAEIINRSLVSLNVIDDTNYPAANMRFFEVPVASGLQLCSSCPEMYDEFRNREHLLYFENEEQLCEQVEFALTNKGLVNEIRQHAYRYALAYHTYDRRADQLKKFISDI